MMHEAWMGSAPKMPSWPPARRGLVGLVEGPSVRSTHVRIAHAAPPAGVISKFEGAHAVLCGRLHPCCPIEFPWGMGGMGGPRLEKGPAELQPSGKTQGSAYPGPGSRPPDLPSARDLAWRGLAIPPFCSPSINHLYLGALCLVFAALS